MRFVFVAAAAFAGLVVQPAWADVIAKADNGFVVRAAARVTATPAEAWKMLVVPASWWSAQHTFSGDAANLSLDPVPGGCFCEKLPLPKAAAKGERAGGVQHLRVVYANPGKALRLTGALGPLQSEALQGTLTITIKPMDGGSRVLFEYVVGGFMRYPVDEIAPAVDAMLSAQLVSLATKLGPVASAPAADTPRAGPPPETGAAETAEPAVAAPAPRAEVPPTRWSLPPGPGTSAVSPATTERPVEVKPAPSPRPVATVRPVARPGQKPAPKPAPVAKPAPSPAATAAQKERDDANAAFDALLGAEPSGSGQPVPGAPGAELAPTLNQ
ncbi:SRPBCC domain-containing protein [Novosphingobium percolationis]|uniref:SRPBCC domain-containing protein n=1 Tax=Novosphingobium percolationis TaxID=2871811 RepID=UPI001CD81070|nr:SRPBCC domain-containing protein [Novosphingobium percolationis]